MPLIVNGVKAYGRILFLALFIFGFAVLSGNASASECTIYQDYFLTGGYTEVWKCGGSNNCPLPDDETLKASLDKFGGRKYSDCFCPANCASPDGVSNGDYSSKGGVVDAQFLTSCTTDVNVWPSEYQRQMYRADPSTWQPIEPNVPQAWNPMKISQEGNPKMCNDQCKIYDGAKSIYDGAKSLFDGEIIGCGVTIESGCSERLSFWKNYLSQCMWESRPTRENPEFPSPPTTVTGCWQNSLAGIIAPLRADQYHPEAWYTFEAVDNKRADTMSDKVQVGFGVNSVFCRADFKTQCESDIENRGVTAKIFVDGTGEVLWNGVLGKIGAEEGYDISYKKDVVGVGAPDGLSRALEGNEALKCEVEIGEWEDEAGPIVYGNSIEVLMQGVAHTDEVIVCTGIVTPDSGSTDFDVIVNVNGGSGTDNPSGIETCSVVPGQNGCSVHVLIPEKYTMIGDTISCSMRARGGIGYSNADEKTAEIYNRPPYFLENPESGYSGVKINPDYYKRFTKEEWVKYSQIFDDQMDCSFVAVDDDSEDTQLTYAVEFNIDTTGRNNRPLNYKIGGEKMCDNPITPPSVTNPPTPPCNEWDIPKEDVYPSDFQKCKVKVSDNFGGSAEAEDGNQMPSFDLVIQEIDVMNVISGDVLIAEKPLAGRVFPMITSDLIDELDRTLSVNLAVDDKKGYKAGKKGSIGNLWKFYGIGTLKENALKDMGGGKIGADFLRKIKRAKNSINIVGFNLPKEGYYYFSGKLLTSDAKGKIKESDETNNIARDSFVAKVWKQNTVYDIGIVVIADPADIATLNEEDIKKIDKNIAFMFAGGPLTMGKTNIKWLGNHLIEYDRGKLLAHDQEAFEYADELQRGLIRGTLEDLRTANNLDFVMGYILDKEIMLLGSGSYLQGLSIGNTQSVLMSRIAGADTLLHEMSHVYTENGEHKNVAFSEHGWCIEQYKIGQISICDTFNGAEKYGHSATRINIWTEFKTGKAEHQSTLDVPEHLNLNGEDFAKLKMGTRYVNIHSYFNNPNNWQNNAYYSGMRKALGGFYKKP